MLLNHYRLFLSQLLFGAVLVLSVTILFTPASGVPSAPPGTDKVIHFLLFAALTITGRMAGLTPRWALVAMVGYAALSEFLQALLPLGRSGDPLDLAFDVLGIAAGGTACWLGRRLRSGWVERGLPH